MAILYTIENTKYIQNDEINQLIAPCEVGKFDVNTMDKSLITHPLDQDGATRVFKALDSQMHDYFNKENMKTAGAFTFYSNASQDILSNIEANRRPHINYRDEMYFLLSGELVFYLKLKQQTVALLLSQGDWMHYNGYIEHWINPTALSHFSMACYQGNITSNKVKEFTSNQLGLHFNFIK